MYRDLCKRASYYAKITLYFRRPPPLSYRSNLQYMSHKSFGRLSQFIRVCWRTRATAVQASRVQNYEASPCLGARWENPLENNDLAHVQGRWAKLLPSAGIVEKVFNYLIDRVTGGERNPFGRVSCCGAVKLHADTGAKATPRGPPLSWARRGQKPRQILA